MYTRQFEHKREQYEQEPSQQSVLWILYSFHPFHILLHQELCGNNFQNHIQFYK